MNPTSAEVWENRELSTGIFRLKLRPYGPARHFEPGRFFMLGMNHGQDPLLRRPLGGLCVSVNEEGAHLMEFLYEVRGRGTELISRLQPPRVVSWLGPLGEGWKLDPPPDRLIMIAGGMGVVPLYAAARMLELRNPRPKLEFIFGARKAQGLVLREELEKMCDRLILCTEDGSMGERAQATELLKKTPVPEKKSTALILACGPRAMLKETVKIARAQKIPCQVSLEARMACGLGACLTCTIKGAGGENLRVCKEGPVFNADQVDWEALDDQP